MTSLPDGTIPKLKVPTLPAEVEKRVNERFGRKDPEGNFMDDWFVIDEIWLRDLKSFLAVELNQTEKAYGGCRSCYGKGYHTTIEYARAKSSTWKLPEMRFCTCERGKALSKEIREIQKAERERVYKEYGLDMTRAHPEYIKARIAAATKAEREKTIRELDEKYKKQSEQAVKEATEVERERCVGIVEEHIERIQDNLKCVANVDVLRVGILIRQHFAAIVKKIYEKI